MRGGGNAVGGSAGEGNSKRLLARKEPSARVTLLVSATAISALSWRTSMTGRHRSMPSFYWP